MKQQITGMQASESLPALQQHNTRRANKLLAYRTSEAGRTQAVAKGSRRKTLPQRHVDPTWGKNLPELLRPKFHMPTAGSWTRFASGKDPKFFKALDAEFALAERQLEMEDDLGRSWKLSANIVAMTNHIQTRTSTAVDAPTFSPDEDELMRQTFFVWQSLSDVSIAELAREVAKGVLAELDDAETEEPERCSEIRLDLEKERAAARKAAAEGRAAVVDAMAVAEETASVGATAHAAYSAEADGITNWARQAVAGARAAAEAAEAAAALVLAATDFEQAVRHRVKTEAAMNEAVSMRDNAKTAKVEAIIVATKVPSAPEKILNPAMEHPAVQAMHPQGVPLDAWPKEPAEAVAIEPPLSVVALRHLLRPSLQRTPEYERNDVTNCFDSYGAGLSRYLARKPTKIEWQRYRATSVAPLGEITRGCTRFLEATMQGGPGHLLPVSEVSDLREVLKAAQVRTEHWNMDTCHALLRELATMNATLFSINPWFDDDVLGLFSLRPEPMTDIPLCPHLLLKRKLAVIHIVNAVKNPTAELVLVDSATESNRGDTASVYRRLSTGLHDTTGPTSVAVEAVSEALGMPAAEVHSVSPFPQIVQSGGWDTCAYPGLGCEHLFYVVRVCVNALPSCTFSARGREWTWMQVCDRPSRPETTAWFPHRSSSRLTQEQQARQASMPSTRSPNWKTSGRGAANNGFMRQETSGSSSTASRRPTGGSSLRPASRGTMIRPTSQGLVGLRPLNL